MIKTILYKKFKSYLLKWLITRSSALIQEQAVNKVGMGVVHSSRKFLFSFPKESALYYGVYLTGTQGALDVSWPGVAGVVLAPVLVLHHPVQSPPQEVLGRGEYFEMVLD